MSSAVILAGGRSSRSGRIHKGLRQLRHQGQEISWLERQIIALRQGGYQRILVATGYRSRRLLAKCLHATQKHNCQPARGPFSTLQSALQGFHSGHTLLVPLDNPVPSAGLLYRLRMSLKGSVAAKPVYAGKGGHPLLLSAEVTQQIKHTDPLAADARLDRQLRQWPLEQIARVGHKSTLIHCNLNTKKQWSRYKRLI